MRRTLIAMIVEYPTVVAHAWFGGYRIVGDDETLDANEPNQTKYRPVILRKTTSDEEICVIPLKDPSDLDPPETSIFVFKKDCSGLSKDSKLCIHYISPVAYVNAGTRELKSWTVDFESLVRGIFRRILTSKLSSTRQRYDCVVYQREKEKKMAVVVWGAKIENSQREVYLLMNVNNSFEVDWKTLQHSGKKGLRNGPALATLAQREIIEEKTKAAVEQWLKELFR